MLHKNSLMAVSMCQTECDMEKPSITNNSIVHFDILKNDNQCDLKAVGTQSNFEKSLIQAYSLFSYFMWLFWQTIFKTTQLINCFSLQI